MPKGGRGSRRKGSKQARAATDTRSAAIEPKKNSSQDAEAAITPDAAADTRMIDPIEPNGPPDINLGLEARATVEAKAAPYEANLEAGIAILKAALKKAIAAVNSSVFLNKLNESQAALMVTESFMIPSAFPVYESSSKLFDALGILDGELSG
jgi:hypothetical protein